MNKMEGKRELSGASVNLVKGSLIAYTHKSLANLDNFRVRKILESTNINILEVKAESGEVCKY